MVLTCDNVEMIDLQFVKMEFGENLGRFWRKEENCKTEFCFCLCSACISS